MISGRDENTLRLGGGALGAFSILVGALVAGLGWAILAVFAGSAAIGVGGAVLALWGGRKLFELWRKALYRKPRSLKYGMLACGPPAVIVLAIDIYGISLGLRHELTFDPSPIWVVAVVGTLLGGFAIAEILRFTDR